MNTYFAMKEAAARAGYELNELDLKAMAILDWVAEAHYTKAPIHVSYVVNYFRNGIGWSAPTIFAHLKALEKGGWIEYQANPEDGRVKLVCVTDKAKRVYDRMSKAMEKAKAA